MLSVSQKELLEFDASGRQSYFYDEFGKWGQIRNVAGNPKNVMGFTTSWTRENLWLKNWTKSFRTVKFIRNRFFTTKHPDKESVERQKEKGKNIPRYFGFKTSYDDVEHFWSTVESTYLATGTEKNKPQWKWRLQKLHTQKRRAPISKASRNCCEGTHNKLLAHDALLHFSFFFRFC